MSSFASSYIKTTTAAVTRTSDALSYPATGNIVQGQGSIVCEFNQLGIDSGDTPRLIVLNDGSNDNRIITYSQTTEKSIWLIQVGGVSQASFNAGSDSYIYGTPSKRGMSYILNNVNGFIDGVLKGSDTSATIPTITTIYIGCSIDSGSGAEANATIKNVQIFKTALDNTVMVNKTK